MRIGLWAAGCRLARRLHQLKASITMDLGISIFLIFVRCMALRNSDLCRSHLQPMNLIIIILPVITKDLPISPRFTPYVFYRGASSAILQLVHQWLNSTCSRSHAFRYLLDYLWLRRNLSALMLRTLVVGRRQQSKSIEAALDMEYGGLTNRFDISRCHCLSSRITFCRGLYVCWSE